MANKEPATGTANTVLDLSRRLAALEKQVLELRNMAGLLTYPEKQAAGFAKK